MAEFLAPVIGIFFELSKRQVAYFTFYENNVNKLTENVEELERTRDEIKHSVDEAIRNGNEIMENVQAWQDRVDWLIEEAHHFGEDPRHDRVCCSGCFPNLFLRYELSRKAEKIANEITELREMGRFHRVGHRLPLHVVFPYATGSVKLESRESIRNQILEVLRDPKVSKIGIYGLGGVGKTTLLMEVGKIAQDHKLFDAVLFVPVSQDQNFKIIQAHIAAQLGMELDELSEIIRAERLRWRMKKEKNILILLDDIWATIDLEKVGIPFGNDHKGCKLLLTSRNKDVLQNMEVQEYFKLEVLGEEEAWNLFKANAGDAVEDPSLRNIAARVAEKSAGLPILITTVARTLRNKGIYAWKDALRQLNRPDKNEMHEVTYSAYSALKLSYDWIKSEEVKAIFLLCGVIGENIVMDELLKYGVGLSIFRNTKNVEDARNRFYKIIGELKASCLLLEDDTSDHVKMHDIIRDFAISVASKDQHVFKIKEGEELIDWPVDFLETCTQIILDGCNIQQLPERLDCPRLKLLYLSSAHNRSLKIPDSFFQKMGSLQVLDLKCMKMSSLPLTLISLNKLKTLCLDQCSLEDMAVVGALKNLEILSLVKSSITKLPSEIGKLVNLRMLDLEGSTIEVIPPKILSNLIKLEELYMGNTTIKWEAKSSSDQNKNASLAELSQLHNLAALNIRIPEAVMLPKDLMFEKLERYKIVVGDNWQWTDIKYGISRTLMLKLHTFSHSEHGIKVLIKSVEDLFLDGIDVISNILYQLDGEGFPLLKYLHIQNNTSIQHIINSVEMTHQAHDSFPSLQKLELHSLSHLDKIYQGPLIASCFSKLRIIKVKNCDRLENLFLFSSVRGLSQLEEIEVAECQSFKEIVAVGEFDNVDGVESVVFRRLRSMTLQHLPALRDFYSHEQTSSIAQEMPFFRSEVAFPKLEMLKLRSLNLEELWEEDQYFPTSVNNLTSLTVEDCVHLKYLFSSFMVESLSNLKLLEINKCPVMEEIIMATDGENNSEAAFPKLETLKLSSLNLKKIWRNEFQLSATSLLNLTSLSIENCGDLKYLFSYSMIASLFDLKRLEISKCHMMEEILNATEEGDYDEVLFPNLETIIISDMENLETIWQYHQEPAPNSLGKLKRMEVKNCGKLKTVFKVINS